MIFVGTSEFFGTFRNFSGFFSGSVQKIPEYAENALAKSKI